MKCRDLMQTTTRVTLVTLLGFLRPRLESAYLIEYFVLGSSCLMLEFWTHYDDLRWRFVYTVFLSRCRGSIMFMRDADGLHKWCDH